MDKNIVKTLILILTILLGFFMFVYGEIDDSPGGQLIGVVAIATGIIGLIRHKKKSR